MGGKGIAGEENDAGLRWLIVAVNKEISTSGARGGNFLERCGEQIFSDLLGGLPIFFSPKPPYGLLTMYL